MKKKVLIGLLGVNKDTKGKGSRWEKWRPTVSLFQHDDIIFDRLELLYQDHYSVLADMVGNDISRISSETQTNHHLITLNNPWDFEEVYSMLHDFARHYKFKDDEEYYLHITTGTHVAQICLFLLTESRHFPARLIQSSPPPANKKDIKGTYAIIDLDLSRYDKLAMRFKEEKQDSQAILKAGIVTRDKAFNKLIERIETVSIRSNAPVLLSGPTGAGKSQLAKQIFNLRHQKHQLSGNFVEVNCATLRGDAAMSTLFGHKKGSFTGALADRAGLLREADSGLLFLDEIGELGLDEQAMLLRALEDKTFLPMGSDKTVSSDFQLICGSNRDLRQYVQQGKFRDDLLARINIWSFALPGLKDRKADIAPNIDYELTKFTSQNGSVMRFNAEAKGNFLKFATSPEALWTGNFRDLNATILRMATLADAGRISQDLVEEEIERLNQDWSPQQSSPQNDILREFFNDEALAQIDPFDQPQLAAVIKTCRESKNLAEAGRKLFCASRKNKKVSNDSDRLRKYLAKFELSWQMINS